MAVANLVDLLPAWERVLKREGLGALDAAGMVSSRGAGKTAIPDRGAELARRRALLDNYVFPSRDRQIYLRWAEGDTLRLIANRFRVAPTTIRWSIRRTESHYRAQQAGRRPTPVRVRHQPETPAEQLARLARDSDPGIITLTVALIRRAVTHPDEMSALADRAEDALTP